MKLFAPALLFVAAAGLLPAAPSAPQFVWEGAVDGIALLHIHGKRVTIETKQGEPPVVRRSRFQTALPDSNQTVQLRVVEGRGMVRVAQQPRLENDYEAVISIEDLQDGAGVYSIELRWSADRGSYDPDPKIWKTRDEFYHLEWRGRVNGSLILECRERTCVPHPEQGSAPSQVKLKFTGPLPSRDAQVVVDETTGRGTIRILEQPSSQNGYTLRIAIRNDLPGSETQSFVLSWPR
jgi:hypothetical protein